MIRSFLIFLFVVCCTTPTMAQDAAPAPEVGETFALERGDRAPWAGMLVRDEDLFALQSETMRLRLHLEHARSLYDEAMAGRATLLEGARLACDERVQLWIDRRDEMRAVLAETRRGPEWWEHPALWFAVGVIVAGAIAIGALALGG